MRAQIRRRVRPRWRGARARASQARTRRLRKPRLGHYGPCARSSLTARFITGHASAEPELGECRKAFARAASGAPRGERVSQTRARLASVAYLVRLAALRSPHACEGEEKGMRRSPRATPSGRPSVGCLETTFSSRRREPLEHLGLHLGLPPTRPALNAQPWGCGRARLARCPGAPRAPRPAL